MSQIQARGIIKETAQKKERAFLWQTIEKSRSGTSCTARSGALQTICAGAWTAGISSSTFWGCCSNGIFLKTFADIEAQDYNLSVSTYMEQEDTLEVLDIRELNKQIAAIVARESVLRAEIDKIIAEIEG